LGLDHLLEEVTVTAFFDKRFCKIRYHVNEIIPLKIEVMLMAHQTPVTPMRAPRKMASGMRSVLNTMLMMDRWGGFTHSVEHPLRGNL